MKNAELLDTNALNAFVTIAESDSLTDAARRLGITQPAVSQCLKQLEAQLGTELVVRRSKPVQLTVAGSVLKQNADQILGEIRRVRIAVQEAADTGRIKCRLGLVTSCAEAFGSKLLAYLSDHAEQVTLKSGIAPSLPEAFFNRDIDILISDLSLSEIDNLQSYKLMRDPMLLAVPEKDFSEKDFSVQRLAQQKSLIQYSRLPSIGSYSEIVLRRMQINANVQHETDDTHTLMSLVKDGHGWAILSSICLAQVLHQLEGIKIVELDNSRHCRDIYLVAREGEMGKLPKQMTEAIQDIFQSSIYPKLVRAAPWIKPDIF